MTRSVQDYIEWYKQQYGKIPEPYLVERYKELHGLQEPEDEEEFDFLK